MGQLQSCIKGDKNGLDIPGGKKKPMSSDEKKFIEFASKIEESDKAQKGFIYFKYTGVKSVDAIILKAQAIINDFHKTRSDLIKGNKDLISKTEIYTIPGATVTHAIMAMIYAISAQMKGVAVDKAITFKAKFPWFTIGKDSAAKNLGKDAVVIAKYLKVLESAYDNLPLIIKEAKKFKESAKNLAKDAQSDIKNMGTIDAAKATTAVKHNATMLSKCVKVINNLMKIVTQNAEELGKAYEIMKEEHSRLPEYGETLAKEGISKPNECYERVGPKVRTHISSISLRLN